MGVEVSSNLYNSLFQVAEKFGATRLGKQYVGTGLQIFVALDHGHISFLL
jgi:hypothetical protein